MKKLILTLTAIGVCALTVYGQGRVTFNNQTGGNRPVTVDVNNQGSTGGLAGQFVGANYSVQLVWAPQGTYASQAAFEAAILGTGPAIAFFGATGGTPTTDGAGLFSGGATPNPAGTTMPAGNYTMQVRAWFNGGQFATYSEALAGARNTGLSQLFNIAATVAPTPANATTGFGAFTVGVIPEPSTFALAGLGAAALLLFRRRK
jgi:hypothetical protein